MGPGTACLDPSKTHGAVVLNISLPDSEITTGYGTPWPEKTLDRPYYKNLARAAGFEIKTERLNENLCCLELVKPLESVE